ncbi:MAG: DJ-1/PfpI family protein, partial [Clostridiales Family XIII bacterium]|nr:DJ-1/PfpI family protein [Clostridiales Family XIII bacterium]
AHEGLKAQLLSFVADGRRIAAICAAPAFALGQAGILRGRKATCYPGLESKMEGVKYTPGEVVQDGNLITSRGPATAMVFALALIEELCGAEKRGQIAADLLYVG